MTESELSWSAIAESLQKGVPAIHRRSGTPPADFVIPEGGGGLALRVPMMDSDTFPLPDTLESISVRFVRVKGERFLEVSCSDEGRLHDFHALLTVLVDRVQSGSLSPAQALVETLSNWRRLLQAEARLGTERQVGLWGELWILQWAIEQKGADVAVAAWTGPQGEPHDFRFAEHELEIKTTSGTRRLHTIHGLSQLEASVGCILSIVSLMIEPSGAAKGFSLDDAVRKTREMLGSGAQKFDEQLRLLGVEPSDVGRYRDRYRLRNAPQFVTVSDDFPRLTPGMLMSVLGAQFSRVEGVDYQIDLTGISGLYPFTGSALGW